MDGKRSKAKNYPWEKWLARPTVVLVEGEHFSCSRSAFAQQIRNAASRLGLHASLTETPQGFIVEVRNATAQTA